MPRKPRIEIAGGLHHAWSRGNGRQFIFRSDADRYIFLTQLERTVRRHGWSCAGYCLMGNHFHLAVLTPEPNLGPGMRDLLSPFVQKLHKRYETDGHLFRERFGSKPVLSEAYVASLLRYIALNPVNAQLCEHPSDWPWSSHLRMVRRHESALVDVRRVDELLGFLGGPAETRYARLVARDGPCGTWSEATSPLPPRPALADLFAAHPLDEAIRQARDHDYRLAEIAEVTGLSESTISRRARRTDCKKGDCPLSCA